MVPKMLVNHNNICTKDRFTVYIIDAEEICLQVRIAKGG